MMRWRLFTFAVSRSAERPLFFGRNIHPLCVAMVVLFVFVFAFISIFNRLVCNRERERKACETKTW